MLSDNNYLAIHPDWVLKNDGKKIVLYKIANSEMRYQILDPQIAVILTFLNGHHRVKELVDIIQYIGELPSKRRALMLLTSAVETLNLVDQKVAILDEPAKWRVDYDPLDFIISPDDTVTDRRMSTPLTLLLYFSGWCQTKCVYCYADTDNMRKLKHLSLREWCRILDNARDLDIRMIQLTGGDTLARPDSIEFIINLIERDFLFLLSTKSYVSLKDALRLAEAGFNEPVHCVSRQFQVSIDSYNPREADYMAGRKGYFERGVKTVRNLIGAGISPRVKAVLTPHNYRQVRNYIDSFSELGVRHFFLSLYARSFYRHNDQLFMTDDMKAEIAGLLKTIIGERPDLSIEGDSLRYQPASDTEQNVKKRMWPSRTGCSAGRTNLGISPDGHAVLCEQMPLIRSFFFGRLPDRSISDIWNSKKLLNFIYPARKSFTGTPCSECGDFDECVHNIGYCFRDAYYFYGQLHHPPPNCPKAQTIEYRTI